MEDNCPFTIPGRIVDANGCEIEESDDDDDSNTILEGLLSGDGGAVTTTVGIGAILLAILALLQTNAVAAMLPETFRWVQVLRNNSKLTKEERNELTYLQSIVQAYHSNPQELAEELNQLKGDLTGRYTNNEIKKDTREKLFTLIDDLLSSSPDELYRIAHNDTYFGLAGSIDSQDRTRLLDEKLAMSEDSYFQSSDQVHTNAAQGGDMGPSIDAVGTVQDDGFEWYESPQGSGIWWYRTAHTSELWKKWQ
jgi:DNA-directed RNA polymerase subunit F